MSKHAFGYCDRTGFRYDLKDLVEQYEDRQPTGLMVGKDVLDKDHEQYDIGNLTLDDPKALTNPRPDQTMLESRRLWSWKPVGMVGLGMTASVGRVKVIT